MAIKNCNLFENQPQNALQALEQCIKTQLTMVTRMN